jgi:hypothetical protein
VLVAEKEDADQEDGVVIIRLESNPWAEQQDD